MRELREDTFSEGKNNDAHEHVEQVLLEPLKGGWTDFPQEQLIPGISLRKLSSKVTVRHPRPLRSLKTSVTSSRKWHDGSSSRNIDSGSSNSEGITAIVSKLDNLCRDMKKLKENVRAIQIGCQTCGGAHLNKEFDFVVLEMVEDFRMPITLGRPLLAIAHATVNIFRKSISLEMGNEKVIFKMRHNFVNNPVESVRAIKSKDRLENDDLTNIDYDLFLYEFESCGINQLLAIDPDIFTYEIEF
ncbi:hypothetical protein Tco_0267551 [Tanacetum coccineum]